MSESERLLEAVWGSEWGVLRQPLMATAESLGIDVYVVGGHVRDLLLDREPHDFDLTVEGDGLAFAERLCERISAVIHLSRRFLTARIELPGALRVDISTARSEIYERRGALPVVTPADIRSDLARRDFTVNTFALGLAGAHASELLWCGAARADLSACRLRVLHERSFDDDPTRVLRAVRQELQLGFRLEEGSELQARRAIESAALSTVSGQRLWYELEPLLSSHMLTAPALRRLAELGALESLDPSLGWSSEQERRYGEAMRQLSRVVAARAGIETAGVGTSVALLALTSGSAGDRTEAFPRQLPLPREARRALRSWHEGAEAARRAVCAPDAVASTVHAALKSLSLAELVFLAGDLQGSALDWVRRELVELRQFELAIGAADLLAHGHPPGPPIGRALEQTLAARLDGRVGPGKELDYALERLDEIASSPAAEDETS